MTRRAWSVSRTGVPTEVMQLYDIPDSEPGPGEVVVEVTAAGLGFPDYLLVAGRYHQTPDLPFVPGGEAAGVVTHVGVGVDDNWIGQRVMVTPDRVTIGLLAERVVVPIDRLLPVPTGMPMTTAAALFVAYVTAHLALIHAGRMQPGDRVLVLGASGGVGMAAVQLAAARGHGVVAVAGGPDKVRAVADAGAGIVIDRHEVDLAVRLKQLSAERPFDVVIDLVGGEAFNAALRAVGTDSRIVLAGFASGQIPQIPGNHLLLKNASVVGFRTLPYRDDPKVRSAIHRELCDLFEQGLLRPLITEVPFENVPSALEAIGQGEVVGRFVAVMGH